MVAECVAQPGRRLERGSRNRARPRRPTSAPGRATQCAGDRGPRPAPCRGTGAPASRDVGIAREGHRLDVEDPPALYQQGNSRLTVWPMDSLFHDSPAQRRDRDAPAGRPEAEETATRRAGMRSTRRRRWRAWPNQAVRDGRRPHRRSTRPTRARIPRVGARPEEGRLGARARAEPRRVRLAHDHGTGSPEPRHELAVARRDRVGEQPRTPLVVGRPATCPLRSLIRYGTPRSGPSGNPAATSACRVVATRDHPVEPGIVGVDCGERGLEHLVGQDLAARRGRRVRSASCVTYSLASMRPAAIPCHRGRRPCARRLRFFRVDPSRPRGRAP